MYICTSSQELTFHFSSVTHFPSSSVIAGAVPAFLISSSSFCFRQSSRDFFLGSSCSSDLVFLETTEGGRLIENDMVDGLVKLPNLLQNQKDIVPMFKHHSYHAWIILWIIIKPNGNFSKIKKTFVFNLPVRRICYWHNFNRSNVLTTEFQYIHSHVLMFIYYNISYFLTFTRTITLEWSTGNHIS